MCGCEFTRPLIIRLNRGDSLSEPLFINKGSVMEPERYNITENDIVYFGLMEPNRLFEQSIMKKVYTYDSDKTEDGDLLIKILPEDTEFLTPGMYYYMIKLVQYTDSSHSQIDRVKTIVPHTLFYIL